MPSNQFRAGAGRASIHIPEEVFPIEGFVGIHDGLHVRVLILESETRIAFVSLELTSIPNPIIPIIQDIVHRAGQVSTEHVIVCVTHTFTAPHLRPKEACKTKEEQRKNDLLYQAVVDAVQDAARLAVSGITEARFGYSEGQCNVNVNRDILTADGYWLGCNETGFSDKTVSVIRIETPEKEPIALLFHYDIQSSVMDGSQTSNRGRLVSADLAGIASSFLEMEYGDNFTAMFLIGAAGDQSPGLKAKHTRLNSADEMITEDIQEQGYLLSEMQGKRLGAEVLRVSGIIDCTTVYKNITIETHSLEFPGQVIQETKSIRPTHNYYFQSAEKRTEPVVIIKIGEIVLVGVRPEINSITSHNIEEKSPYPFTQVMTMVNGGAKYMPDGNSYDRITYEAMNSYFAKGSAELLVQKVVGILQK